MAPQAIHTIKAGFKFFLLAQHSDSAIAGPRMQASQFVNLRGQPRFITRSLAFVAMTSVRLKQHAARTAFTQRKQMLEMVDGLVLGGGADERMRALKVLGRFLK